MSIQPSASGQAETSLGSKVETEPQSLSSRLERLSAQIFIWPAVVVLLILSIFPLIISLYISLSRIRFVRGGLDLNFVGFANYRKQLLGSEQRQLLGVLTSPSPIGWLIFGTVAALLIWFVVRYIASRKITVGGLIGRALFVVGSLGLSWLFVSTVTAEGRPGTLMVTLIYVFVGIFFQYSLGLGLAMLAAQQLPGNRFFRVVFLLPMMITPVGVAYMFRMLADTSKGPLKPIWQSVGLGDYSWVDNPWSARAAVLIGDVWQWTPFVFIVLLAAIEAQPVDPVEAATVDGASRWQIFRYVTWPAILPATATIVLIRMIEAFKIVDLPQVLTNGGPGTATRSLTLQAFINWKAVDLGGSAAVAYILLIVSTFVCVAYANFVHKRATS
jgi:multiple sugar transport system permease protein